MSEQPPTHPEFDELLEALWAGQLDADGRARLERLALEHPALAERLRQERALDALLRRHGPNRAPAGLAAAVLARIDAPLEGPAQVVVAAPPPLPRMSWTGRLWRYGLAAAVLILLVGQSALLMMQSRELNRPPQLGQLETPPAEPGGETMIAMRVPEPSREAAPVTETAPAPPPAPAARSTPAPPPAPAGQIVSGQWAEPPAVGTRTSLPAAPAPAPLEERPVRSPAAPPETVMPEVELAQAPAEQPLIVADRSKAEAESMVALSAPEPQQPRQVRMRRQEEGAQPAPTAETDSTSDLMMAEAAPAVDETVPLDRQLVMRILLPEAGRPGQSVVSDAQAPAAPSRPAGRRLEMPDMNEIVRALAPSDEPLPGQSFSPRQRSQPGPANQPGQGGRAAQRQPAVPPVPAPAEALKLDRDRIETLLRAAGARELRIQQVRTQPPSWQAQGTIPVEGLGRFVARLEEAGMRGHRGGDARGGHYVVLQGDQLMQWLRERPAVGAAQAATAIEFTLLIDQPAVPSPPPPRPVR